METRFETRTSGATLGALFGACAVVVSAGLLALLLTLDGEGSEAIWTSLALMWAGLSLGVPSGAWIGHRAERLGGGPGRRKMKIAGLTVIVYVASTLAVACLVGLLLLLEGRGAFLFRWVLFIAFAGALLCAVFVLPPAVLFMVLLEARTRPVPPPAHRQPRTPAVVALWAASVSVLCFAAAALIVLPQ